MWGNSLSPLPQYYAGLVDPLTTYLLAPYCAWLSYATYLNGSFLIFPRQYSHTPLIRPSLQEVFGGSTSDPVARTLAVLDEICKFFVRNNRFSADCNCNPTVSSHHSPLLAIPCQ